MHARIGSSHFFGNFGQSQPSVEGLAEKPHYLVVGRQRRSHGASSVRQGTLTATATLRS